MQEFNLSSEELQGLRLAHRSAKNRSDAYRINAIILLGSGWSAVEVADALLMDDETIKAYIKRYQGGGIKMLLENNYKGGFQKMSTEQTDILCEELDRNIYLTTKSICSYVKNMFGIHYTISGMTALLRRLGYVYKKPKDTIPIAIEF